MTDAHAISERFAHAVETLRAETWSAWKLGETESRPLAIEAETLAEAEARAIACSAWHSGDKLAILHTHAGRNKRTLRLYAIRISPKRGHWRDSTNGGRKVWCGAPEPMLWMQMAVAGFSPVEAFDAFRDDSVGVDRSLVIQP